MNKLNFLNQKAIRTVIRGFKVITFKVSGAPKTTTMWVRQCQLHLALMTGMIILFSCHAQTNTTELFTSNNYTTPAKDVNMSFTTGLQTTSQEMPIVTTKDQRSSSVNRIAGTKTLPDITPPETISNNIEKYKTGIMICIIIIAVLVFVCAILIIFLVVLANKVESLKKKLVTSKRQARSNGDFLSASSTLWPNTLDTWQKKVQAANHTMDEISLGDANDEEEKHQLMLASKQEGSKSSIDGKMTTIERNLSATVNITVEL